MRKAAGDLLSCMTGGRERFTRELERLRGYEAAAVVVETTFDNLVNGDKKDSENNKFGALGDFHTNSFPVLRASPLPRR